MKNDYVTALPIMLKEHKEIEFIVVGCGGNGSFFLPMLARLIYQLNHQSMSSHAIIIDPDLIELKNIPRQNFIQSELGLNKAEVLATRYALAYGIKIGAITQSFTSEMIKREWGKLIIIIGAVDNNEARQEIAKSLVTPSYYPEAEMPSVWWLDMGNHGEGKSAGQVLLGSSNHLTPQNTFNDPKNPSFCVNLPAPSLLHPELLKQEVEIRHLSCAEIAHRDTQALFINQRVATEAIEMVSQLIYSKTLKRFATYFHNGAGSSSALYTSIKTLQQFFQG
jgi:PRTRC genetic system ThiF family protein